VSTEDVGRLELVGLAAWQTAEELRQVRERFPEAGDTVARLAREVEEVSRTLAGECAMRLREAAGRVAIAEHDRPLPHLLDTAPKLYDVLAQVRTHWRCARERELVAPREGCDCWACDLGREMRHALRKAQGCESRPHDTCREHSEPVGSRERVPFGELTHGAELCVVRLDKDNADDEGLRDARRSAFRVVGEPAALCRRCGLPASQPIHGAGPNGHPFEAGQHPDLQIVPPGPEGG